ncbi:MAG: DUF86 domain-containing protein [Nitrospirales bacterium]|nr:DUF86 domain-containing protein [Nitrospirales bacterium]
MSKDSLRLPDYINHILEAIKRINRYVQGFNEAAFLSNEEKQDSVIRNIEVIGEAARNIERHYPDFAARHPEVPWTDIYLMRNRLSHGYFSVDMELVWKTVQHDIPVLEQQILHLQKTGAG